MEVGLDSNYDVQVVDGDFVVLEQSAEQDVALLLQTLQGEWKLDPIAGMNLFLLKNREKNPAQFGRNLQFQVERDGKDYNEINESIVL